MTLKVHICKRNSATHKNKIQHRHRFKEKTWINKVLWHNPVKLEPKTTSSSSSSLSVCFLIYLYISSCWTSCFLFSTWRNIMNIQTWESRCVTAAADQRERTTAPLPPPPPPPPPLPLLRSRHIRVTEKLFFAGETLNLNFQC